MTDERGLSPEELEAESAEALPERAAMSTINPDPTAGAADAVVDVVDGAASDTPDGTVGTVGDAVGDVGDTVGGVGGAVGGIEVPDVGDTVDSITNQNLLDLDVNVDADVDGAAPVNAGVAANANAALPIDAAVSANTLSPGAQSLAAAEQASGISQNIEADAIANSTQDSTIGQGEVEEDVNQPDEGGVPADSGSSLLDLDANVDLGLDLAAPVDAAVAANVNLAAPIDAAVSANTLSPDSTSVASASQESVIVQNIEGTAQADADQTSSIEQGEETP
jgi:hypothetical protein